METMTPKAGKMEYQMQNLLTESIIKAVKEPIKTCHKLTLGQSYDRWSLEVLHWQNHPHSTANTCSRNVIM